MPLMNSEPVLGTSAGLVRARSMRFTGVFMILCVLAACGEGRHDSLATPVLFYNGSDPFPAVLGEPMALTPAVFWTISHYTVSPPLPPGLSLMSKVGSFPVRRRRPVGRLLTWSMPVAPECAPRSRS